MTSKEVFNSSSFFIWQKKQTKKIKISINEYIPEFDQLLEKNIFDIDFLKTILIPYWELDFWCNDYNVPMPGFWLKPFATTGTSRA